MSFVILLFVDALASCRIEQHAVSLCCRRRLYNFVVVYTILYYIQLLRSPVDIYIYILELVGARFVSLLFLPPSDVSERGWPQVLLCSALLHTASDNIHNCY